MTAQKDAEKDSTGSGAMRMEELLALPATVNVVTAGRALGISPNTAYELIRNGQFPVRTLRLGNTLKVPTALLWEALGVKGPQDGRES
ncbi:helix-turn-helix domain-containing protein [Streptomyces ipomoeae]|nr:helix-turn-helix domain-containing protein [Streptomyces ipomoeae]